jgi:biotin operon repressor
MSKRLGAGGLDEKDCLKTIKALADTSRLRLLNSIMRKSQYVEELSERMGLSASTVSFHLKKLEEAGLVAKSRDQYYAVYKADERILDTTLRELIAFENIEAGRQEARIRNYREKVVRSFFKDNRLIRLPAQYKKKRIVLEEIARRFEPDRKYPEKEVNAIILEVFGDYCTVRRLMIDVGMMERKDNVYRRPDGAAGGEAAAAVEANRELTKGREKQHACEGGKMKTRAELKREYKETVREME